MSSLLHHDVVLPLTLSEQLDAMLLGWLERRAGGPTPVTGARAAKAVVTVGDAHLPEVEAFCARWEIALEGVIARRDGRVVLVVAGPALPVEGFAEITAMYRR